MRRSRRSRPPSAMRRRRSRAHTCTERLAAYAARRGTETMRSWSSPSAESTQAAGAAGEPEMVRRFVEASRRAEIIAMVNSAGSEEKLAESVSEELCEAFEAE